VNGTAIEALVKLTKGSICSRVRVLMISTDIFGGLDEDLKSANARGARFSPATSPERGTSSHQS
jgi:hypothetical protein